MTLTGFAVCAKIFLRINFYAQDRTRDSYGVLTANKNELAARAFEGWLSARLRRAAALVGRWRRRRCCELAQRTGVLVSAGCARCGGTVSWLCRLRTFLFQPVACQQVVGFCLAIWVYAVVIKTTRSRQQPRQQLGRTWHRVSWACLPTAPDPMRFRMANAICSVCGTLALRARDLLQVSLAEVERFVTPEEAAEAERCRDGEGEVGSRRSEVS